MKSTIKFAVNAVAGRVLALCFRGFVTTEGPAWHSTGWRVVTKNRVRIVRRREILRELAAWIRVFVAPAIQLELREEPQLPVR